MHVQTDNLNWCTQQGSSLSCGGEWTLAAVEPLERSLEQLSLAQPLTSIDASGIKSLDSTGAMILVNLLLDSQSSRDVIHGLRPEQAGLLDLVLRHHRSEDEQGVREAEGPLALLGRLAWEHWLQACAFIHFIGEVSLVLLATLLRPSRIRWKALARTLETAGFHALPILALLSFLMGVVIAYQGGQQLANYGANIFIVELVSLTMVRELAPLLTAIIVAGRTGSAFTAQIGTMVVTEEVDAMRTIGIVPMELLVLPKIFALVLAMPLLVLFADIVSVFGGMVMARFILDVSFSEFIDRIPNVLSITSFLIGIGKVPVFAAVIAVVGCFQGFQVQGDADSVGRQTTVSVVQAIFLVIVVDAFFSVVLGGMGL